MTTIDELQERLTVGMHHFREGVRKMYGDRYSREIGNRIKVVRQVMEKQKLAPLKAAYFIMARGDAQKNDPLFYCAALEIVDEDSRATELN